MTENHLRNLKNLWIKWAVRTWKPGDWRVDNGRLSRLNVRIEKIIDARKRLLDLSSVP